MLVVAVGSIACSKDTGAPQKAPPEPAVAPPSDAALFHAAVDPDTSPVPDEWAPSVRFRRNASRFGVDHVVVAYGERVALAGITFEYVRHAWSDVAQRGRFTLVATKGNKSVSHEFVADAEVMVFARAFLIDGYYDELWIGWIEKPLRSNPECSRFGLAQIWQAFELGGEWKGPDDQFYDIPRDARSFEMDGMFHVDYRGVRVSCGTLSGRVFAEHLPKEPTP